MNKIILIIGFTFLMLLGQQPVGQIPDKWKLIWNDEFNGTNLNSSWIVDSGGWVCGFTSPDNVKLTQVSNNGYLIIESFLDNTGNKMSGKISYSRPFKYGFFEIKCSYSSSSWPCFWLMPRTDLDQTDPARDEAKTAGAEIDIVESFGTYPSTTTQHNVISHYTPQINNQCQLKSQEMSSLWQQYGFPPEHPDQVTFGFEWTPNYYVFYIKDNRSGDTIFTHVSHVPQDLIISSQPGSTPSQVTYTRKPQKFMVDYVRVWYPINGYPEPDTKVVSTIVNSLILH